MAKGLDLSQLTDADLADKVQRSQSQPLLWKMLVEEQRLRSALRDRFAMAAITGLLAAGSRDPRLAELEASQAYRIADLMLAVRRQGKASHGVVPDADAGSTPARRIRPDAPPVVARLDDDDGSIR